MEDLEGRRREDVKTLHEKIEALKTELVALNEDRRNLVEERAKGIDDAAVPFLLKIENLEVLELPETSITAEGLARLSRKKDLKQLFIGGVDLTPEEVEAVRKALPDCLVSWWKKPKIEYRTERRRGSE